MPKFSTQEKEQIQQSLLDEGERLFTVYGLKKVTIDDIAAAVHIAKATFYRFYEGKEYLFLDIVQHQQFTIFSLLDEVLTKSKDKPSIERTKELFFIMSELMQQYPLLVGIDKETIQIISRKVSPERLYEYGNQGFDAVQSLEQHGIAFRYDSKTVSLLFHTLYDTWLSIQNQPKATQTNLINIILDGVLQEIL